MKFQNVSASVGAKKVRGSTQCTVSLKLFSGLMLMTNRFAFYFLISKIVAKLAVIKYSKCNISFLNYVFWKYEGYHLFKTFPKSILLFRLCLFLKKVIN